jgi:hypothetical protein
LLLRQKGETNIHIAIGRNALLAFSLTPARDFLKSAGQRDASPRSKNRRGLKRLRKKDVRHRQKASVWIFRTIAFSFTILGTSTSHLLLFATNAVPAIAILRTVQRGFGITADPISTARTTVFRTRLTGLYVVPSKRIHSLKFILFARGTNAIPTDITGNRYRIRACPVHPTCTILGAIRTRFLVYTGRSWIFLTGAIPAAEPTIDGTVHTAFPSESITEAVSTLGFLTTNRSRTRQIAK